MSKLSPYTSRPVAPRSLARVIPASLLVALKSQEIDYITLSPCGDFSTIPIPAPLKLDEPSTKSFQMCVPFYLIDF